jgi:hypothetical protein
MSEDDAYRLREGKGVAGGNPHLRKPKHRLMQVSLQSGKPLFEGFRVAKRAEAPAVTDVGLPVCKPRTSPKVSTVLPAIEAQSWPAGLLIHW